MSNLSIVEKYSLCVLGNEKRDKALFYIGKSAACIVASVFIELLLNGTIGIDNKNKVIINKKLDEDKEYLKLIYNRISSAKPRSLKRWMEYYLFTLTYKSAKEVIKSVIKTLEANNNLQLEKKRYFLKEKITYNVDNDNLKEIIQNMKEEFLEKNTLTKENIVLGELMLQSKLLKKYFSKYEKRKLKARIKEAKKSELWKDINLVQEVFDELKLLIIFFII